MKAHHLLLAFASFSLIACGSSEAQYGGDQNGYYSQDQNGYGAYDQQGNNQPNQYANQSNGNASQASFAQDPSKGGEVVMHNLMDSKTNTPFAQIPLPASWKLTQRPAQGAPAMTGPGGVEIYAFGYQSFMYSNDPMMQQLYQQNGVNMRQPAGIEQVLNGDLMQYGQQNGLKLIQKYPLPQVAQVDASYANALYSVGPKQNRNLAAGTDWTDKNGNKVLIVLHYNENGGQDFVGWGYYIQLLKAPASSFEQAKNHYINGLANMRYNPQHIQAYNNAEQSKAQQSNSQFQASQQQKQRNFDQQQSNYRATQDHINQSSMDAFNSRMESMDRNQHNFTNYIKGESTVTNPTDGNQYQVEAGANQYWMNNNGEYIPSNDYNYDPNQQMDNPSHQEWEVAPVDPY